ncbi:MAG: hemolysin family protein, partial [Vicinamibacteria bacterium]
MGIIALESFIILLLILASGALAMSEIAVVSARKARLRQRAEEGDSSAATALELARAPDRFLSTVQIGITLVGVLAGALGGATIAEKIEDALASYPPLAPYAEALGVGVVVAAVTYLSLILGELVPKRIALNDPERIASLVAPSMRGLARIASPAVRFLTLSAAGVLRLLRVRPSTDPAVTEDEIRILIEQGTAEGTFDVKEKDIVSRVFRLGDRPVAAVMTPRSDVVWIDLEDDRETILRTLRESGSSQLPVAKGDLDQVKGVVRVVDWL